MKVSVVIPFQNRPYFNCLSSVLRQSYCNIEIVLIDYQGKWNVSKARNQGINRGTGAITTVLDADMILERHVISTLAFCHAKDPDSYITAQCRMLTEPVIIPRDMDKLDSIWKGQSLGWGGMFSARTEWWKKLGGFDERRDHLMLEDVEMRHRAGRAGMNCMHLNRLEHERSEIRTYHEHHPNTYNNLSENEKKSVLDRRRELPI